MGASNCVVVYGMRYLVDESETEALERRVDPRQRLQGLEHYWGDPSGRGEYVLLVGTILGVFGPEHDLDRSLGAAQLQSVIAATDTLLQKAGVAEPAQVHFQWFEDF